MGIPILGNSRLPTLGASPMARHIKYYKGEGGGFPQVWVVVNVVSLCCSWLVRAPKVFQLCTHQLVGLVCVGLCE